MIVGRSGFLSQMRDAGGEGKRFLLLSLERLQLRVPQCPCLSLTLQCVHRNIICSKETLWPLQQKALDGVKAEHIVKTSNRGKGKLLSRRMKSELSHLSWWTKWECCWERGWGNPHQCFWSRSSVTRKSPDFVCTANDLAVLSSGFVTKNKMVGRQATWKITALVVCDFMTYKIICKNVPLAIKGDDKIIKGE